MTENLCLISVASSHNIFCLQNLLCNFSKVCCFSFRHYENLDTFLDNKIIQMSLLFITAGIIVEIIGAIYYYMKYVQIRERLERGEI